MYSKLNPKGQTMTSLLKQPKSISLYHYELCPFCAKTRRVIDELDLEVELKNIQRNHQYCIDLFEGGHKVQVPCLCIKQLNGDDQWLYESDEIINFLAHQQNELFLLTLTA